MKKATRMVALLCIFALIATMLSFTGASASAVPSSELCLVKNDLSVDVYTKINRSLTSAEGEYVPDYAGAYIDKEGNLNIQFVKGTANRYKNLVTSEMLSASMSSDANASRLPAGTKQAVQKELVKIEETNFSYQSLMAIKELISDRFGNMEIKSVLKQETNSINVYAADQSTLQLIKAFLEEEAPAYEEGMVHFILDENCVEEAVKSGYPGNKVHYNYGFLGLSESFGTIGFNALYNGTWGIVTNSHVAPSGQTMKCADGTIGTPTFSYIGGKVDVAFIPYPSGWSATSALLQPNSEVIYREATASEMVEGGLVIKYGTTTGKTMNGYITSTSSDINIAYSDGTKLIRDCFSFSNNTQAGDSGGPVGRGNTKEVFRLLGITVSKDSSGGSGIKLSNIKAIFPMTVKTG